MEKNSGKGAKGEQIKNLSRGSISCRGQDSLETESVQPNSPLGEWLNDDESLKDQNKSLRIIIKKQKHEYLLVSNIDQRVGDDSQFCRGPI